VRKTDGGCAFLDFESSGIDHALLDAAYLYMAFPTCWCAGNIPPEILTESLAVYRQALASGAPEAGDEAMFARHFQRACARWLLTGDTLVPRAQRGGSYHFLDVLRADWSWGCSTARQRLQYRLQAFIQLARIVNELPAITGTVERLRRVLVLRWPADVHHLPDFPAFGVTGPA
jgi:hypothetical protein